VPAIRRLIERSAESATAERSAPGATRGDTPDLERYDLATQLARRLEDHDDRLAGLAIDLRTLATDTAGDSTQVGDLAARLHRTTAAVRLVEPGDLVNRLHLAVKDAAHRLERQVVFHADTGAVLLDRALVDPLATALTHVVRNAVDHGIRPPAERRAAGLPDAGRIALTATAVGGAVTIQVSDDGPGLNAAAIRARATTLGLDAATPVEELIFSPGFSTRADADDVSGRGVGLDAAAEAIARIGGRITAAGTTGTGCTISLRLPPQVAVAELVLVQIGGRRCALPRAACARIARADTAADAIALAPNLGLPAAAVGACITLELPGRTLTVGVDRVLGMSEAVVQPPGRLVSGLPLISGVVVPDDDLPIPVLDAIELVRRLDAAHTLRTSTTTHANAIGTGRLRVLVVDDSLAVRKVAERFLLDAGCDVALAVDGAEALELLRSGGSTFQAVISDLEMPHVDGYHLLSTLRATSATRTLPVAIMSSRRDDQHRAEAHRLGADAYLTKPFTAAQLTAFVHAAGHRV
jgi:chemotaxis protein histidine kinase CheA/CheY-like chemotaxis protein